MWREIESLLWNISSVNNIFSPNVNHQQVWIHSNFTLNNNKIANGADELQYVVGNVFSKSTK